MKLATAIKTTLLFQGVGVVAMALVHVVVAQRYGPEGQGYLNYFRSTVMMVVQLCLVGLPQALVYILNSRKVNGAWAVRFATLYTSVVTLTLALVFWLASDSIRIYLDFQDLALIAMAFAIVFGMTYELYRAIVLATRSNLFFNAMSILPATLSILIYFFWFAPDFHHMVFVLFIANLASTLAVAIVLGVNPFLLSWTSFSEKGTVLLSAFRFGTFVCFPGIIYHLSTVAIFVYLRRSDPDLAGYFSIGLVLLTFFLLPIERLLPVFYNIWSKKVLGASKFETFLVVSHVSSLALFVGPMLAFSSLGVLVPLVFGEEFLPAVIPSQLLLSSAYLFCQSRLISTFLLSLGAPKVIAIASIVRALVILSCFKIFSFSPLLSAVLAWITGELFGLVYLVVSLSRRTPLSVTQICGLSFPQTLQLIRNSKTTSL